MNLEKKIKELERKLKCTVVNICYAMPTENVGTIIIFDSKIFFWNGTEYEKLLTEDDASSLEIPTNLMFFSTNVPSTIPGYNKLVYSLDDPDYNTIPVNVSTGAISSTSQLVGSLISNSGIFAGNTGIININTIGEIRKVSGTGTAEFYYEIYKRDSLGTETLVCTSNNTPPVTSTLYQEFNASALLNNTNWLLTDSVVIKYYANKVSGGSNPTYEFLFGGNNPVRTLFPVAAALLLNLPISIGVTEIVGGNPNRILTVGPNGLLNQSTGTTSSVQLIQPILGPYQLQLTSVIPFTTGQRLRVAAFDDPLNYFEAYIDSEILGPNNTISIIIDIISLNSYAYNDWRISTTGEPGFNAYLISVNNGFNGSEQDWLNSLQGTQGTQGTQGISIQGIQGRQGTQGLSIQGIQGVQGLSVQGIQGTQGLSIQGIQGASVQGTQGLQGSGIQGIQGIQGLSAQGIQGLQGLSAFVIVSDTVPLSPVPGDLWFNTADGEGKLYIRYNDGDSQQWVEAASNGRIGLQGTQGIQGTSVQGIQGLAGSSGSNLLTFDTWSIQRFDEQLGDYIAQIIPQNTFSSSPTLIGFGSLTFTNAYDSQATNNSGLAFAIRFMWFQATAGARAGARGSNQRQIYIPATASFLKETFFSTYFTIGDTNNANGTMFIGLAEIVTDMSTSDITSQQNCIGWGKVNGSDTLRFRIAGTVGQDVNYGSNFSLTQSSTFYCAFHIIKNPTTGINNVRHYVKNLTNGIETSGTISVPWNSGSAPVNSAGSILHAWRQIPSSLTYFGLGPTMYCERYR